MASDTSFCGPVVTTQASFICGSPEIFDRPLRVKVSEWRLLVKLIRVAWSCGKSRNTSSTTSARPCSPQNEFNNSRSHELTYDPVGLLGCTRTTARVLPLTATLREWKSICQP